jgi:branched-chain amino acid transport system substrate-binding protein
VEKINAAGGVLGRPLELIVVDDEMKAEKGAAALERLATVDNVDVFVGGMSSGVALGEVPTMKKYQRVTVWTGAASYLVEQALGADSDWFFHLHPWDYEQGESYLQGWTAITGKFPNIKVGKWFLAYEEGAFGTASYKATGALFANFAQVEGESFKSAALGGGDYKALLEHAKAAKPDVYIWAGYDADALPMLEQAKAINFAPPIFLGAPPGWPADFGKSPLSHAVMLYGMWAPSIKNVSKVSDEFYSDYVKKYGAEPATYFAPLSYACIYIVAEAIQRAGTLDREALIKALEQTKYDSPLGETITFTPANIIKHQGIKQQKILQWQNGVQQVIWPFEVATARPIYPLPPWDKR